jgi:hypothetical protein
MIFIDFYNSIAGVIAFPITNFLASVGLRIFSAAKNFLLVVPFVLAAADRLLFALLPLVLKTLQFKLIPQSWVSTITEEITIK